MSSSETLKPKTPISEALSPKPQVRENEMLSSKTPEKPQQLRRRARSCNIALSIEQVRRSASKSLFKSNQKQRTDQIDSWPEETQKKTRIRRPVKLPEKYEILGEFFNCLDISIRRLRKKGLKSIFTNICPAIEYLTERRFTYGHLAQLKFVLPEVIEIKKLLVWDERTCRRKPDLHVSMNIVAVENNGMLKSQGGGAIMHLRKAFWKRLADISKSHPEDYEIPEETLPHPFNAAKQHVHSDRVKFPSSSSPGEVEQPAVSTICLRGDEIPDETHPMPSNQSKEDLNSNINHTPKRSLVIKTSVELPKNQQPAIAAYLSQSFQMQSSQEAPATPTKKILPIKDDDGLPRTSASITLTPEKLASTPARLMTLTPALHPPKRCYMSPDDDSISSPNKLVKHLPCSRSLKFNTPMKNKMSSPDDISTSSPNKLVRHPPCSRSLKFNTPVKNNMFEEEAVVLDDASSDSDVFDVLPEDLLQSLRDKERKAISLAKRRRQMISSLPELFNMIHFLFQSMNYSFMKKEDLVDKIIFSHSDIIDEGEVEEQLKLLLELVPDWISENLAPGRDLLVKINKISNPESIRARLEDAK
ncbi:hypothetical protein PRUPE_8G225500 [Prunus persica]|uniref:CDT1 Geminin-binding domain-containing protein n=1 Tax=Prunus persica TaxID=3760 RepID=A0A251N1U6_PRUPE|nr:hypothetical protein PRUPE_8G225500 [Prunus persica]